MISYLQVENLTKSFGDNLLFENISFGIADNQRVALIAKNGSGKTTLLNIIAGIEDYQEGTVTSFAPGQVVEVEMQQGVKPNAHGLLFHPDLIKGTSLGQDIKHYSFFSYTSAEALHLSEEEKGIFIDCLEKIKMELQRPIDKHSKRLISRNIELLLDVSLRVTVELGRTRMKLAQILELQHGSVVELDRLAGDPVDIFVNDRMVAHGEVVVVDDKFGVRITEMISPNNEKAAY